MLAETDVKEFLRKQGADFIRFVDISTLDKTQNKGFSTTVLFGIGLTPGYLKEHRETPDFVQKKIQAGLIQEDEFHLTELKTDRIADKLARYLNENGHKAYSQSERNIEVTGFYDKKNYKTPLPHKTIALIAGLGWIGKHNLLVMPEFGSGICMCTVLCNMPANEVQYTPLQPQCGGCDRCVQVCPTNALTGNNWEAGKEREHVVDVRKCSTCYKCVVQCPYTTRYIKKYL